MGIQVYNIAEDEYRSWLTPAQTLTLLADRWTRDTVIEAILNRASLGMIRAAAEMCEIDTLEHKGQEAFLLVPKTYWRLSSSPDKNDTFWRTGDVTFSIPEGGKPGELESNILRYGRHSFVSYTGVRFERSGVEALGRQLGRDVPPPETADGDTSVRPDRRACPRLPDPWLAEWHRLFLAAYPSGSIEMAQQSVDGMFPKHHTARQRVRDLFPNAPRGRPLKNKDEI